jgi:glucose/arabinose dehydrogenase
VTAGLPSPQAPSPTATLGTPPRLQLDAIATVPKALTVTAADGSGRLFVARQDGRISVLTGGQVAPEPVLDLAGRITTGGERGLLGLAFHPRFPSDPRLFVNYTDLHGDTVIASYPVVPGNPVRADAGAEQVILKVPQPYANHNGGGLAFGPDGYLYLALGDGGSAGDPQNNAQRLDTLLGKLLRIDVDGSDPGLSYRIPPDNPFVGQSGARAEIWHYGLRNPFRFSFDRATGDLWIGDVGQSAREEIDVARRGAKGLNFGWARTEGSACYPPTAPCSATGLTLPVTEYRHDQGCSVVGGYVYHGVAFPTLRGWYTFADYCSGLLFALPAGTTAPAPAAVVGSMPQGVASFGEDAAGEIYVANVATGSVSRLVPAS